MVDDGVCVPAGDCEATEEAAAAKLNIVRPSTGTVDVR